MSINCAYCKELIEDDPIRRGRLYFCSVECLEDYETLEAEHEEDHDYEREHDDY